MGKTKLILVSNQIILREALAKFFNDLPDIQVIGNASSHREALDFANKLVPDLLLVDVELPETSIKEIVDHLTTKLPSVNLIFLSSFARKRRLIELIPLNARGYLTYDLSPEVFARLLDDACQGRMAISPSILDEVVLELRGALTKKKTAYKQTELTSRERDVLCQLVSGATNREIAHSLVISECTVKNHIHNILGKLNIQNRNQLIYYALTTGLLAGVAMLFVMVETMGITGHFC